MRQFVESLGRLYADGKVDKAFIQKLLSDKKINKDEADFIFNYAIDGRR